MVFTLGGNGNSKMFFTRSTDNGASFSNQIALNNNNDSALGDVDAIGSNVYVTWSDASLGTGHAFFKRSTDNGAHFGSTRDLGPALEPGSLFNINAQLDAISSNVYVVWEDDDSDIVFRASTDNGAHFGSSKNLSDNSEESTNPQISSSGDAVHA